MLIPVCLGTIKGDKLRTGMLIHRDPDARKGHDKVGKLTGRCSKGLHYGNGCYDMIATWWLYEMVDTKPAD